MIIEIKDYDIDIFKDMIEQYEEYLRNDYEQATGEEPVFEKEFIIKLKKQCQN